MQALNPDLVLALRVASATDAARDIRRFDLVDPGGAALPPFTPGAHALIQAPSGATRRYSLCNGPSERDRYVIAVKRERDGRGGSVSIVDHLAAGDEVFVSLPRNDFALATGASSHLFIAGGIGITPIRSMVRDLADRGVDAFRLYYLTRAPDVTAFRDEFRAADYRERIVIHHDFGDPAQSLDLWPMLAKPRPGVHVYCCGPRPLLEAVRDMTGHWSLSAVHFEDFAVRDVPRRADDKPLRVRIGPAGPVIDVPATVSILEALRAHGYRIPSSCESGTCGTCRTKVLQGKPEHRDLVLTDAERRCEMTVCVSRAQSDELVLAL